MKIREYGRSKGFFAVMAAVALVMALIGILNLPSTPYTGFEMTADSRAFRVDPDGPAAKAGIRESDEVVQVGVVPTDRLHELAKQNRPKIGEVLRVSVLRDSVRNEYSILQTGLPARVAIEKWAANLMALAMLALGLVVFWCRPSKPSSLYFLGNLCFALALTTPPYFQHHMLRTLVATFSIFFLTMGLAFLLHLSVVFPKPKPLLRETNIVESLIYLPAQIMAVSFLALRLFEPKADLLVNLVLHQIFALVVLACVGLSLAAAAHSFWKAGPADRSQGLGWLLGGFVLGSIPPAAGMFMGIFLPNSPLPGQSYYSLAPILASLGFGWALWKSIKGPAKVRKENPVRPIVFKKASGQ